ncbi:MAG: hypothetical protein EOO04_09840 [Chitinophagaceae bacterium]|nr:MAG: hypothetical protein EOO04_09840 [Chitinophagaceae bacterium]
MSRLTFGRWFRCGLSLFSPLALFFGSCGTVKDVGVLEPEQMVVRFIGENTPAFDEGQVRSLLGEKVLEVQFLDQDRFWSMTLRLADSSELHRVTRQVLNAGMMVSSIRLVEK